MKEDNCKSIKKVDARSAGCCSPALGRAASAGTEKEGFSGETALELGLCPRGQGGRDILG